VFVSQGVFQTTWPILASSKTRHAWQNGALIGGASAGARDRHYEKAPNDCKRNLAEFGQRPKTSRRFVH
jgi:hypothetical protein